MTDLQRQRDATYAYWRGTVANRPAGAWADLDGVQVHTTGIAVRPWNGAFTTRAVDLAAAVPHVAAWFAARDMPWGLLIPAELTGQPPGLRHLHDQPVMLRSLAAPLPPVDLPAGVQLRADAPELDVANVAAEAFADPLEQAVAFVGPTLRADALPAQQTVTAYAGPHPVGTATVATMDGVAGVYGVAVRAAWRRRGLGAALTTELLHRAVRTGCDLGYLNPSELGYGVYARLGFVDVSPFRIWVPD